MLPTGAFVTFTCTLIVWPTLRLPQVPLVEITNEIQLLLQIPTTGGIEAAATFDGNSGIEIIESKTRTIDKAVVECLFKGTTFRPRRGILTPGLKSLCGFRETNSTRRRGYDSQVSTLPLRESRCKSFSSR